MSRWALLVCGCMLALTGCVPKSFHDPLAVMLDRRANYDWRTAAAAQAEAQGPRDPHRLAALRQLLWDRGYPAFQRIYAINQLVKYDQADFRAALPSRITLLHNDQVRQYLFDLAVKNHWHDFTAAAVHSYAVPSTLVPDAQRPERAVIAKLNPGKTVNQVVFRVFADADGQTPPTQQTAAWALLCRLCTADELTADLAKAPDTTPLVVDLKAAAAQLHVLPHNREGVLWLTTLRGPKYQAFWDKAAAAVARLTPAQRQGLQLRHLPVLLHLRTMDFAASRAELLSILTAELARQKHYYKGPTFDGPMRDYPQTLADWANKLCWMDLQTICLLDHMLTNRALVRELFRQARADHDDTSTEYGGVLDIVDGEPKAIGFPPELRGNDLKFLPPPAMITRLYTAIAHYHFHAQSFHNREFAGPGVGDLDMVNNLGPNAVVFTYIDPDHLNVDYYQPGGAVIDLGTIHQ